MEILREALPGVPITGAAELRPVIREYERTTLAVLNAYSFGAFTGIESLADDLRTPHRYNAACFAALAAAGVGARWVAGRARA